MTAPSMPASRRPATIVVPDSRRALSSVAWFVGLCLVLAAVAVAMTPTMGQLVPFILALGPALIAGVIAWREGNGSLATLVRMAWRRPSDLRWYLVVALPVAAALATVAIGVAVGRSNDDLFRDLLPAAVIVPLVVLIPAFAEEVAWRGFAVSRLMTITSPLLASLILSIPWTIMHLVLMVPGGMNEGADLWPAVVQIVAYSVLLTWVFVGTGGSVLVAGLVHAGLNGVVPLMRGIDGDASWAIRAIVAAAIAIAIVALGGLSRRLAPTPIVAPRR